MPSCADTNHQHMSENHTRTGEQLIFWQVKEKQYGANKISITFEKSHLTNTEVIRHLNNNNKNDMLSNVFMGEIFIIHRTHNEDTKRVYHKPIFYL